MASKQHRPGTRSWALRHAGGPLSASMRAAKRWHGKATLREITAFCEQYGGFPLVPGGHFGQGGGGTNKEIA